MSLHTIQIDLPDKLFRRVKKHSELMERTIAEEVVAVITDTFSNDTLPKPIEEELSRLDFLSDEELWSAAKMTAADEHADRMQVLLEKQGREGLLQHEEHEMKQLSDFFNQVMLVRAKAAALLKERGHDVDHLAA